MRLVTRGIHTGEGRFAYPYAYTSCVSYAPRPRGAAQPALAPLGYTQAGPAYKGMDPSDPLTYVRPWNPQPGLIAYLNFDGAQLQGRTPTGGLQRGPQRDRRKPRRLKVSA